MSNSDNDEVHVPDKDESKAKMRTSSREKEKNRKNEKRHASKDRTSSSRKKRTGGKSDPSSSDEEDKHLRSKDKRRRKNMEKKSSTRSSSRRKHERSSRSSSRRKRDRDRRERKRRRYSSSESSSSSSSDSSSSSEEESRSNNKKETKKIVNQRLLEKLAERGETLEERETRRIERRAARITAQFGYTSTENPFNDANLAETFTWNKKVEKDKKSTSNGSGTRDGNLTKKKDQTEIIHEIEKVRKRRSDYEEQKEEMERIRAEESRMKELENYDEWARKEEEFHLQQQRQRSAIRLVEGRERPIDVLAKNLLLFGLSDGEKKDRAKVNYKEKYNAMEELENLEAELQEPHVFLKDLKLNELEDLLKDIHTFRLLEKDVGGHEDGDKNSVLKYWDSLHLVTRVEIIELKGGHSESESELKKEIQKMFVGQSKPALEKMKDEVEAKVKKCIVAGGGPVFDDKDGSLIDMSYWQTVLDELLVELSKMELSDIHSKMLVCQLEQLEKKKESLSNVQPNDDDVAESRAAEDEEKAMALVVPDNVETDFGNLEEELGLTNEIDLGESSFMWQEKYRPRKPRYFNRVKTGYDWNKYNQNHYDHDTPPPKTVQGYKFNIFYPDLIDRTQTPRYFLESTKSQEYCIIRFNAGPPYEDVAFKIINREWNKSRKRGFKCTFERGVLSLYFNFKTHWYRK